MSSDIKVSVLCLSYNQAKFIRQTLDGFLMQKTDFKIEVLINDDSSTDGTVDIIKEYQGKYPDIIKPVFHKKNQYSQGKRNFMLRYLVPKARGEYFALCEGDDYWTDPKKLQKQVDFLEKHKDFALVFHPVRVFFENGEREDETFPRFKSGFTTERLLGENYIQTNSVMYRARSSDEYRHIVFDITPVDWYLHLYHAQFGEIGFINHTMSVYRRHEGGIWWGSGSEEGVFFRNIFERHMKLFGAMRNMYGYNDAYLSKIDEAEDKFVKKAVNLNFEDNSFLQEASKLAPRVVIGILHDLYEQKKLNEATIRKLETDLLRVNDHLRRVVESYSYKIGRFITYPLRTAKRFLRAISNSAN